MALISAPAFAGLPVPPANTLSFRVMRKGDRIGTHTLNFTRSGDDLTVDIAVQMAVYLGPVRMFHYDHHNVERWKAGSFEGMEAKTDYNGEAAFCTMRREGDQFTVEGSKATRYTVSGTVLAATHWNKAELNGPMINPENGMTLHPAISDAGSGPVGTASGANVAAHRYSWRGRDSLDLWYDGQDEWVALKAITKSGEVLTYEKL